MAFKNWKKSAKLKSNLYSSNHLKLSHYKFEHKMEEKSQIIPIKKKLLTMFESAMKEKRNNHFCLDTLKSGFDGLMYCSSNQCDDTDKNIFIR